MAIERQSIHPQKTPRKLKPLPQMPQAKSPGLSNRKSPMKNNPSQKHRCLHIPQCNQSHQKMWSQHHPQPRPPATKDPRPKRQQTAAPMEPIPALPESWSTIPDPWSPLKSCHDTQKQTAPQELLGKEPHSKSVIYH